MIDPHALVGGFAFHLEALFIIPPLLQSKMGVLCFDGRPSVRWSVRSLVRPEMLKFVFKFLYQQFFMITRKI